MAGAGMSTTRRAARALLGVAALSLPPPSVAAPPASPLLLADRLTWGADAASVAALRREGLNRWLDAQLRAHGDAPLPPAAQAQVDAMRITREPMAALVVEIDAHNRAANALTDPVQKQAARDAYGKELNDLAREAQARSLLRDLYAPDQLREQMTWFWVNHLNVQAGKRDIRAMVGDYEDAAIRPRALGRFRDLLEATLRHPAMLRYLDNDQNAAGHINENYARELMELHTLGVGSGYTQGDVQELARVLTGVGVSLKPDAPRLKPALQPLYVRAGLFEFNPARHDFGDKVLLGHTIKGSGYAEVGQALDILAAAPATARHLSRQIAEYFVGDDPPPALVDRMTATWQHSHGDIAAVLRTMARSPEFTASLGRDFKDPVHYAVSAVRAAYDGRVVLNAAPIAGWLQRLGEPLYGHETPDGYPLGAAAWTGPGQMETRFEIARQIGGGPAGLFKPADAAAPEQPAFPQLQNALFYDARAATLAPATRAALDQSRSSQEWNALFLSSPDFMHR